MLAEGSLVDVYRTLYPDAPQRDEQGNAANVEAPIFTWRGSPGAFPNPPESGRYFRKGMRIDHFLISEKSLPWVASAKILGRGESSADPSFLGSDHCPMELQLKPSLFVG